MRGRIVFNGNIRGHAEFLDRVRPLVLGAAQGRPPKVLLVTAAWGRGEYDEAPIRAALNAIGVPSDWQGGVDRNVSNLCAWHVWQSYLKARPAVAAVDAELRDVEEATRAFYVEKTSFHADRVRRAVRFARARIPGFQLGKLPLVDRDSLRPESSLSGEALLARALARELVHDLADLVQNDARMLDALEEAEEMLPARTGLRFDPLWREERAKLEARILEADAIVIPGGEPADLLAPLRFFDLRPALRETLRRGASFFTVSAGSLVMCERMIVYDDYSSDPARREFRLWDRGLGLVGGLQVLPHCMDRIHTDDPDNLAYLSRRFASHLCVGLNEESFLLVEPGTPRAVSVGEHDGVYVFGPDGVKWKYHRGETIPMG
ncbi:MAG: Type 1 glutamine amidotransferase-like domain-containing protein [Myxococcota bacterium]